MKGRNIMKANEACRLLFLAAAALTISGVGAERSAAQSTFGWDYNLMHECVNSVGTPGSQYYYADHSDCPVSGEQWQIAVESEASLGQSCPGPIDQSLPINQNGILTLQWLAHVDEFGNHNWKVHLKTDLINYSHPCGSGYFTWYRFGDPNGPFPMPDVANLRATINYSDSTPNGASRCFVWWDGFWDGKSHVIEMNLAETNWGTNPNLPPGYLLVIRNASSEYVNVDGSYFGLTIPKSRDVLLNVYFWPFIQEMINKGYFTAPTDRSPTGWATTGMYFGTEPNNFAASNSVAADLYFTNFRVTAAPTGPPVIIPRPATYIASFSGTLNGTVDTHGLTTTVYFQYGTTTSYGHTTAAQSKTGNTNQNVAANISGLSASTTYHFRMVTTNSAGTVYGYDRTFTTLSATGPPVVTTNPATLIASFSATLNGTVDPHGLTTAVHFQYGTTTSYGSTTPSQTKTGSTYQNVGANISSLNANTTYHFRIVTTNSAGTIYSSDRTFATLSATGPPIVTTNPATLIASYSATLNGTLDPHGLTTTVYFQYGTTTTYGFTTAAQSKTGNTYQNVVANISGLTASTTYHFRIVATNSAGTRYGADRTFTTLSPTGPPVVITNPATNVVSSSATLNGSLDPHGLTTSVHFQYGTTTSYGHTTASQSKTGNTYQSVSANIAGLSASTTFHFRIVATNSAGTSYGSDRTFTTP
jgi:hypothetical protein